MTVEKTSKKSIAMKPVPQTGMRAFGIGVRTLAFVSLYLVVMSAAELGTARWLALLPALCVAVPFLVFDKKIAVMLGIIGGAALYSVLCVAIDFGAFADGAVIFSNNIAAAVNKNMHSGWVLYDVEYSAVSDFLFASVVAVWLALGTAALCRKSGLVYIVCSTVIVFGIMIIGSLPEFYGLVLLAVSWIGLLVTDRGFSLRSAVCYLAVTAVVFALVGLCFLYAGSAGVKGFRGAVGDMAENMVYGSDTLPQGRLADAGGLHADSKDRLVVTMSSRTPKLYLKGFVGTDMKDNEWQPTDKNKYVEDGYRGLIEFVEQGGLPFLQYSKYSALNGAASKYNVTVNNVGANKKYMYVSYGLSSYSDGKGYYDLNMRNGSLSAQTYAYSVFTGDGSSEWTTQSKWLLDESLRSVAMNEYLGYENEYRAFVYDVYTDVDKDIADLIHEKLYGIPTDSINTAARLLRTYFEENYVLSDTPDKISGDFLLDFFNGKIKKSNAIYYATAATYVFRSFGFAARYAEGYLAEVPDEDGGAQNITITSQNAHAWTEVYFDGIGWLPIEVTFEVKDPTITVDPDDPDVPVNPPEQQLPEIPDDKKPTTPDAPNISGNKSEPMSVSDRRLLVALKIVMPILCVALGCVLIALSVILRRCYIIFKKRNRLQATGSDFGRAAYGIVERDCRCIGGHNSVTLVGLGIDAASTARFMQLIEKSVYGGYDLNVNERNIVMRYINSVASAVAASGNDFNKFVCKYVRCLGV